MSSYSIRQTSRTASSIIVAGVLAGQFLTRGIDPAANSDSQRALGWSPYRTSLNPPSFDQYTNLFTGEFEKEPNDFADKLSRFYGSLLLSQEPLDRSFEQVLRQNLWDLYER